MQSVLIFSTLNHPCSLLCYSLFSVLSSLGKLSFEKFPCNYRQFQTNQKNFLCTFSTSNQILIKITGLTTHPPIKELLKRSSIGKSCSSDADVFLQSQVLHLMFHSVTLPVMSLFALIWFNAADVMRSTLHEFVYQQIGLCL